MFLVHLVLTLLKANPKTDNRNSWLSLITVVISFPSFIWLYLYRNRLSKWYLTGYTLYLYDVWWLQWNGTGFQRISFVRLTLFDLFVPSNLCCRFFLLVRDTRGPAQFERNTVSARDLLHSLSTVNHCSACWRNCIIYFFTAHSSTWISSWIKKRNSQPSR
jgi:hypothetical protein